MNTEHALCPRKQKSKRGWTKYIHGASAIFAWYISKGESVTILSRPPPDRFHPSEATSFQVVEKPIIMGKIRKQSRTINPDCTSSSTRGYRVLISTMARRCCYLMDLYLWQHEIH